MWSRSAQVGNGCRGPGPAGTGPGRGMMFPGRGMIFPGGPVTTGGEHWGMTGI